MGVRATEKRKRKAKGKDSKAPDEQASLVAGGEGKGEARYCFRCGDPLHLVKDCPKKRQFKVHRSP